MNNYLSDLTIDEQFILNIVIKGIRWDYPDYFPNSEAMIEFERYNICDNYEEIDRFVKWWDETIRFFSNAKSNYTLNKWQYDADLHSGHSYELKVAEDISIILNIPTHESTKYYINALGPRQPCKVIFNLPENMKFRSGKYTMARIWLTTAEEQLFFFKDFPEMKLALMSFWLIYSSEGKEILYNEPEMLE